MSIKAIGWALEQQVGNPLHKLVLVAIAEHANRSTWVAWPSRDTISEYAECSGRTVTDAFKHLTDLGMIERVQVGELEAEDWERYERIPANRRPKLWRVQGGISCTPRVEAEAVQGGSQGGSSFHQNKPSKPSINRGRRENVEPYVADNTPRDPDAASRLRQARTAP